MWLARDKDGELWLYSEEPTLNEDDVWHVTNTAPLLFRHGNMYFDDCLLNTGVFSEITFENSPIELIPKYND